MKRKAKDEYRRKVRKQRKTGENSYQVSRQPYVDAGLFGDAPVNTGRKRSWTEFGSDMLAGAAGASLGYISGNVPGAIDGAYYANRASQLKRRKVGITLFDQEKTKVSFDNSSMSGRYEGRISKSKLKSKSSAVVRNKYQGYGAVCISETYGYVTDPDVLGVGHVTWNYDGILKAIGYSILRKLFLQSGIIVQTVVEVVRMIDTVNSGGFKLVWNVQSSDGTITPFSYDLPVNQTLEFMWANCGIQGQIQSMIESSNPSVLERIMLMTDGNRVMGQLIMRQQRVSLTVNVHTCMQNRTKSATGEGSLESTVVDAQPIRGPVFQFNGIPKTKEITPVALNSSYNSGVILFRKGQLGGSDPAAWSEPPTRKSFYNVTKSSYVRLAPGVVKDFQISKTWSGNFQTVLRRFKINVQGSTVYYVPGLSQVAFFEEEINSGSSNKITVNYETQHTIGCMLTTIRAPNMQPAYSATPQNNF